MAKVLMALIFVLSHCYLYIKGRNDGALETSKEMASLQPQKDRRSPASKKTGAMDELVPHIEQLNHGITPVAETAPQPGYTITEVAPTAGPSPEQKPIEPEIVEFENYRTIAGEQDGGDQIVDDGYYSEGMAGRPVKHEEDILDQE